MSSLSEKAASLIVEVAADKILPRFRQLSDEEIEDKGGGDPVTIADIEAEKALTPQLKDLLPGSKVIGEEAVHETPQLLDLLDSPDPVWIIDPVDGTKNFAEDSPEFVVIVALAKAGETIAGWIYQPTEGRMTIAEKGSGAYEGAARLAASTTHDLPAMNAAIHTGKLVKERRPELLERAKIFKSNEPLYCAGLVYQKLARGELDCAFYGRTKPWDHAAGALILEEAGGHTAFTNNKERYEVDRGDRLGLLAASSQSVWDRVHTDIIGDLQF